MRTNAIALALLALTGCGAPCARNSDCASGYVCTVYGECVIPPSDGGVDGGAGTGTDAGSTATDARTVDASTGDALLDAPSPVMNGVDEPGSAGRGSAAAWQRGVVDEPGSAGRGSAAAWQRGVVDEPGSAGRDSEAMGAPHQR